MGLFEKWSEFWAGRKQRRVEKYQRAVRNAKAMKEDRQAAIDFFAEFEDLEVAVKSLLCRFDYSLEHGINDTREKEAAMEGIVNKGKSALPYVLEHLRTTSRIAWPVKIIKELGTEQEVIEALESALNFGEVAFDQAQVEKNYDVLCYLREYPLGERAKKLSHFLKDNDERVRFAAVETLLEQKNESLKPDVEVFLADGSSENTRIRQSVASAYAENGWKLHNLKGLPEGFLTAEFRVEKGQIFKA